MSRFLCCVFALSYCFLLTQAARVYFTNTNGGDWKEANNWSSNSLPTTDDDVFLYPQNPFYHFTVNLQDTVTVKSLTMGMQGSQPFVVNLSGSGTLLVTGNLTNNYGTLSLSKVVVNGTLNAYGSSMGQSLFTNSDITVNGGAQLNSYGYGPRFTNCSLTAVGSDIVVTGTVFVQAGTVFRVDATRSVIVTGQQSLTPELRISDEFMVAQGQLVVAGKATINTGSALHLAEGASVSVSGVLQLSPFKATIHCSEGTSGVTTLSGGQLLFSPVSGESFGADVDIGCSITNGGDITISQHTGPLAMLVLGDFLNTKSGSISHSGLLLLDQNGQTTAAFTLTAYGVVELNGGRLTAKNSTIAHNDSQHSDVAIIDAKAGLKGQFDDIIGGFIPITSNNTVVGSYKPFYNSVSLYLSPVYNN